MSDYDILKEYVRSNIRKAYKPDMKAEFIKSEVENAMDLVIKYPDIFTTALRAKEPLQNLSPEEWDRMTRELETQFNVANEPGIWTEGKRV